MSAATVDDQGDFTCITMGDARVEVWPSRHVWNGWQGPYVSMSSYRAEEAQGLFDLRTCLEEAERVFNEYVAKQAKVKAEAEREEARRQREREEYRKRQEEERAKRLALAAKLDELTAERTEMLMHEFVDEPVRARAKGYKQAVRAHVRVNPVMKWEGQERVETGDYRVTVEYVYDNDYSRPTAIRDIRRMEIKDGSRYKVLWDDGREDLGYNKGADALKEHKIKEYEDESREEWS